MPNKNSEKRLEYQREWHRKNRDRDAVNSKEWKRRNKERYYTLHRIWERANLLTVNGKRIRVQKRHFYGICELCRCKIEKNPHWHHWDDEHPEKGLWLCFECHARTEVLEHYVETPESFKELYRCLKEVV